MFQQVIPPLLTSPENLLLQYLSDDQTFTSPVLEFWFYFFIFGKSFCFEILNIASVTTVLLN